MKRSSAQDGRGGRAQTAKQRRRRKLASEARSVDRRLKAAVVPNFLLSGCWHFVQVILFALCGIGRRRAH